MKTCRTLYVISIFMAVLACAANGGTIYVDASATGANNGSSWGNAYIYLQDALAAAISGDNIWVAQGTYKPDHGVGVTIGNRMATFELKAGVSIYGGFPTGGGIFEQRYPNLNETIFSGDLNSDDQPNFVNNTENSYNVAHIGWTSGTTILDGIIITAANNSDTSTIRSGNGAGLYDEGGGDLILNDCVFIQNRGYRTAGLYIKFSNNSKLIDCIFTKNYTRYAGAAIYFRECNGGQIENCQFLENTTESSAGAIYILYSSPTIKQCSFVNNSAPSSGGAIYCKSFQAWPEEQKYSNPTIINTEFVGNSASSGVIYISGECTSLLTNCLFAGNSSEAIYESGMSGGGLTTLHNCTIAENSGYGIDCMNSGAPIDLSNCIVWGNNNNGLQIFNGYTSAVATNSCIQDAVEDGTYVHTGAGPGVITSNCIDWNPRFVREPSPGADEVWGTADDDYGDLRLRYDSPCVDAGDNAFVPPDTADLDGDGNITELTPYDLDRRPRIVDGDCNSTSVVDMGAYEFAYLYLGDFAGGCDVDFADFAVGASAWLSEEGQAGYNPDCDIALPTDGIIDEKDLEIFVENWLLGK